jgi:hypothetical protein
VRRLAIRVEPAFWSEASADVEEAPPDEGLEPHAASDSGNAANAHRACRIGNGGAPHDAKS